MAMGHAHQDLILPLTLMNELGISVMPQRRHAWSIGMLLIVRRRR
jgi:hypothetical protein